MPVYNTKAEYLREAIKSVIWQSKPCFELIVVNDGSTRPETLDELNVISGMSKVFAIPEICVINQENKKISGALNTGIRYMHGEWWAGCGSDDTWYPDKLRKQIEFIKNNLEAKVIYCDWDFIDANGKIIRNFKEPEFKDRMEAGRYIIHDHFGTWGGMLVHRSVFDDIGLFDEEFPTREDYEMNIRILTKYMMHRVPETLFTYRLHNEQLTNSSHAGSRSATGKKYCELAKARAIKHFGEK